MAGEHKVDGAGNRIEISVEDYNRLNDEWALAIGRFLVAFTGCEYWTYLYIETFGSKRMREAVADMNLAPRAKLARALVSDLELTDAMQARVDAAFNKVNQLSGTRNLVAHNPPMVHVYTVAEGENIYVRTSRELRSARDPAKDVTIERLTELQAEAVHVEQELALLYGEVRKPENRKNGKSN